MFHVGRVQHAFSAPLAQMHAAANQLTMLLVPHGEDAGLRIVRINLGEPQQTLEADVPACRSRSHSHSHARAYAGSSSNATASANASANASGPKHHSTLAGQPRMFVDPTGTHVLVSVSGDNYYWTPGWTRAQALPRLAGMALSSAVWTAPEALRGTYTLPPPAAHAFWVSSGHVLLGTETGAIVETLFAAQLSDGTSGNDLLERLTRFGSSETVASADRFVHHLHSIEGAVTGLSVQISGQHATVLATTPTQLHEFQGAVGGTDTSSAFNRLFAPYRGPGATSLRTELPGTRDRSVLVVRDVPALDGGKQPGAFWLTDTGVYRATLQQHASSSLSRADMVPLPSDKPRTLLASDWHLVFVSDDSIHCTRVLDHAATFDTTLTLSPDERILGATSDAGNGTYWVYTDTNIFEIIISEEDRDIWRVCLDKGEFEYALQHAKTDAQRELVHACHADRLVARAQYIDAARELAHTSRKFESVVLLFIDAGADDALREYVSLRLGKMRGRTQRLVLATWLIDLSLHKLNTDEAAGHDTKDAIAVLRELLVTYRTSLDPKTTLELISRHGRADIWFHYARLIGDYESIIARLVSEQRWDEAIAALGQQSSPQLYYKFSGVLMRHAPAAVTEAWTRNEALDVRSLIPALLQHCHGDHDTNYSILFLEHATSRCEDHAVHNLLLTFLAERAAADAQSGDRATALAPLLRFIEARATRTSHFDPDYALRICARKGLREACVRLYAAMDLFEDAVDLALESGDVDLACRCADRAQGTTAQKELWLKVARYVVDTQDMHAAMAFLQRTPLLSIEDILPFFPDFSVIDDVKMEICNTLENYVERIDALKSDMERMALTAGHIQDDIQDLSKRFLLINPDQACVQCSAPLSLRHLYIFPCRHGFHADCLVAEVTRHLPPRLLRRLLQLQEDLAALHDKEKEAQEATASGFPVSAALSSTARVGASVASGLGSLKLDRLRELVRPDAIVDAIGSGLSAGMASGRRVLAPLDPFAEPRIWQRSDNTTPAHGGGGGGGHSSKMFSGAGAGAGAAGGAAAAAAAAAAASAGAAMRDANTLCKADALRTELNTIVAGACPVCTLTVHQLTMPFVGDSGSIDDDDWAI
ncbi:hypothetical protein MCUN1_000039 [Malassezia cuniculi]|uniref:Pep3/Vps18/deep orange domain-containing protein n=1 Tax=Malassezia cuniculi TaxID=948313 RepID=A0AAF0J9E5_9BASI|nr:hypothetical protein MCUN1_000039 [Malassezia cuniculi]